MKLTSATHLTLALALSSFAAPHAHAILNTGRACQLLFIKRPMVATTSEAAAPLKAGKANNDVRIIDAKLASYKKFEKLNAGGSLNGLGTKNDIAAILNDLDVPAFGERFEKIVNELADSGSAINQDAFYDHVRALLKTEDVPERLVEKGINENRLGSKGSLRRLLGDLTFEETRSIYMGEGMSGTDYSPDSLIGHYIKATGAATKILAAKDLATGQLLPEKKLFIAVSAASFAEFQKVIAGRTLMSSFGHGAVINAGKATTVWGVTEALRPLSANTPLPLLILKTSEGERLRRYLDLAAKYPSWDNPLKQPWRLMTPGSNHPYVAAGAYHCCTNFIGNIPIGDKTVSEYVLPMNYVLDGVLQNPSNAYVEMKPSKLSAWNDPQHADLKNVWTVPGHEQLSGVAGLLHLNADGEFASPGYVIQSLMGHASAERVPVVFFFAPDHTAEIPDEPALHYEGLR